MRAVVITQPGEPSVLQWLEVPDPVPGPGEVVVDVATGAVVRWDTVDGVAFLGELGERSAEDGVAAGFGLAAR